MTRAAAPLRPEPCPRRIHRRAGRWFALLFLAPLAAHALWWFAMDPAPAWHNADWSSAGLLPVPRTKADAVVHVYAARVGRWRGVFADHTWIVIKDKGASSYTRYDKTFWGRPVKTNAWAPDARWYGHTPVLVGAVEGRAAEALIPKIRAAVTAYPHAAPGGYRVWPGPNSNSFVAHVLRAVPESGLTLPPTAIGKDWRTDGQIAGFTPSGTGVQLNLFGLAGLSIGWVEGIEINVLGLVTGLDLRRPGVKLPGFGRIGV